MSDDEPSCCRDCLALGRDDGEGIAHVADLVATKHGPVDAHHTMRVTAGHILVREDRVDAFEFASRCRINGTNASVGYVGAFRAGIQHAGEMVVVRKASRPPDLRQSVRVRTRLANLPLGRAGFGQVGRYILAGGLQDGVDDALVARAAAV